MVNILLVGVGGFIGAVLRYKIGGLVLHHSLAWKFPADTDDAVCTTLNKKGAPV